MFCFGGEKPARLCDVTLHSILVLGMHFVLRYDEVLKLRVEHISTDGSDTKLTIRTTIKNPTEQRVYTIREWPGNTELTNCPYMDPVIALYSWQGVRGSDIGPLYCDLTETRGGVVVNASKEMSSSKFTKLLRNRLEIIGIGKGDVMMYSGHSIKRGAVQLYRSLNLRDEKIMEIVQMKGPHAYANYCAAYKDCASPSLPRFASWIGFVKHAETIGKEHDLVYDEAKYAAFVMEVFGTDALQDKGSDADE